MRLTRYRNGLPELAWRAMAPENRLQKLMADFFVPETEGLGWYPDVDVVETETEMLLRADLPGMSKDDVQLEVKDGALVMKGEKKEQKEEKDANYRVIERSYGSFERVFALPSTVDAEQVRAEFKNGVLEVHLPKTAKAQGRKVLIADK